MTFQMASLSVGDFTRGRISLFSFLALALIFSFFFLATNANSAQQRAEAEASSENSSSANGRSSDEGDDRSDKSELSRFIAEAFASYIVRGQADVGGAIEETDVNGGSSDEESSDVSGQAHTPSPDIATLGIHPAGEPDDSTVWGYLQTGQFPGTFIMSGSVGTEQIADRAVTMEKLSSNLSSEIGKLRFFDVNEETGGIAIGNEARSFNGGIAIGQNALAMGRAAIAVGTDSAAISTVGFGAGARVAGGGSLAFGGCSRAGGDIVIINEDGTETPYPASPLCAEGGAEGGAGGASSLGAGEFSSGQGRSAGGPSGAGDPVNREEGSLSEDTSVFVLNPETGLVVASLEQVGASDRQLTMLESVGAPPASPDDGAEGGAGTETPDDTAPATIWGLLSQGNLPGSFISDGTISQEDLDEDLVLAIGAGVNPGDVVMTDNIEDGAVTREKLSRADRADGLSDLYNAVGKTDFFSFNGSSISIGSGATSHGIAIGTDANALEVNTVAIGARSFSNTGGVAVGWNSSANTHSSAFGWNAAAGGRSSLALGQNSVAQNVNSIALGVGASATGDNSIAIGAGVSVSDADLIVLGTEDHSVRIPSLAPLVGSEVGFVRAGGDGTLSRYDDSVVSNVTHTAGTVTVSYADGGANLTFPVSSGSGLRPDSVQTVHIVDRAVTGDKIANASITREKLSGVPRADGLESLRSVVSKTDFIDIGTIALAIGSGAETRGGIAIGSSRAGGIDTVSIGTDADASGTGAIAIGGNSSSGAGGVAFGRNSNASGTNSLALGYGTVAQEVNSVALGAGASATGVNSVAIGAGAMAADNDMVVLGKSAHTVRVPSVTDGFVRADAQGDLSAVSGFLVSGVTRASGAITVSYTDGGTPSEFTVKDLTDDQVAAVDTIGTRPGSESGTVWGYLQAGGLPGGFLVDDSVTTGKIEDGTILESDLSSALLTTIQTGGAISDRSIMTSHIGADLRNLLTDRANGSAVNSTQVGISAVADSDKSSAFGKTAQATGIGSTAVGTQSNASEEAASAFGLSSEATGTGSTAVGDQSASSGPSASAFGQLATAEGSRSIAVGVDSTARNDSASAFGDFAQATGKSSLALGASAEAAGFNSVAIGFGAMAMGTNSIAIGTDVTAPDNDLIVLGDSTHTVRAPSVSGGFVQADADGDLSAFTGSLVSNVTHASGGTVTVSYADGSADSFTVPTGGASFNFRGNDANSTQIGDNAQASAQNSTAYGHNAVTSVVSYDSTAVGQNSLAFMAQSTAIGQNAFARFFSTAVGQNAKAETSSTAIGQNVRATGDASVAVGQRAKSIGNGSSAFGRFSTASGESSLALGTNANASGHNSAAIGANSVAGGINSVAIGAGVSVLESNLIVIGKSAHRVRIASLAPGGFVQASAEGDLTAFAGSLVSNVTHASGGTVTVSYADGSADSFTVPTGGTSFNFRGSDAHSTQIGDNAQASGQNSTAYGHNARASTGGTAFGQNSLAFSFNSTAVGQNALAPLFATAVGQNAKADISATAIGHDVQASFGSVAVGQNAESTGNSSSAFGRFSESFGDASLALGTRANSSGHNSAAIGADSVAGGINSVAIGAGVMAPDNDLIVLGKSTHTVRVPSVTDGFVRADAQGDLSAVSGFLVSGVTRASGAITVSYTDGGASSEFTIKDLTDEQVAAVDTIGTRPGSESGTVWGYLQSGRLPGGFLIDGSVTRAKLADDSVNSSKIVDATIGLADISDVAKMSFMNAAQLTGGQVAAVDTIGTRPVTDTTGTVWGYLQSGSLPGGFLIDGSVTRAKLADDSVNSAKIVDATIGLADISDAAKMSFMNAAQLTGGQVAAVDTIGTRPVTDTTGTVWGYLQSGRLPGGFLVDGSVTGAKLADDSVNSAKIVDATIGLADISDSAKVQFMNASVLTDTQLRSVIRSVEELGSRPSGETATVWESIGVLMEGVLNEGSVMTDNLVNGSVTSEKLAARAVTTGKIDDGAVTAVKLATRAVTTGKIDDGAVTTAKLANESVTSGKIANGTIDREDLSSVLLTLIETDGAVGNDSITTDNILDGTVTSADISDGTVLEADLSPALRGRISGIESGLESATSEIRKLQKGMAVSSALSTLNLFSHGNKRFSVSTGVGFADEETAFAAGVGLKIVEKERIAIFATGRFGFSGFSPEDAKQGGGSLNFNF